MSAITATEARKNLFGLIKSGPSFHRLAHVDTVGGEL